MGKSGAKGWQGDVFVMQGRGRRRGPYKVFILTAVMHGVAGDDHWRGHGNCCAAHAELIGDGIICTAAARLASSGSWEEESQCWKIISNQIDVSKEYQKLIPKICCSLVFLYFTQQNKHEHDF